MPPPIDRRLAIVAGDERGATLALVALLLTALLGLTALVVDLGAMRAVRRGLIPATDAAALAAAQDMVDRPWDTAGACATAGSYVQANAPEATIADCRIVFTDGGGVATVAASEELSSSFVAAPDGSFEPASAASAAVWGRPAAVSGLRPVGLCYDGLPELRQLIDDPPTQTVYLEVPFPAQDPAACGGSPGIGNFLSVSFDGGANRTEIGTWTREGYPEPVALDGPTTTGCDGVPCFARPYAIPAITISLQSLASSGRYVPWPVFDYADGNEVHLMGVLRARLDGFSFSGPVENWRLWFKVLPGLVPGTCCDGPGLHAGNRVVAICGVDGITSPACEGGGIP